MAETKTKPTAVSVDDYIAAIDDERVRDDSRELIRIMKTVTNAEPYMWGPSIVGFGSYHYTYASGHEGDAPIVGFSPRKGQFSVYLAEFEERDELLAKLGRHKMGKACLYVKRLDAIDTTVLEELVRKSVEWVRAKYP